MSKSKLNLFYQFFNELYWLLKHGLPLLTAFKILSHQKNLKLIHEFLYEGVAHVSQGNPFSELFSKPDLLALRPFVVAGESSGQLDKACAQAAEYLSHRILFRSQIKSLLVYPCFLLILLFAACLLLLLFIIPQFKTLYMQIGAPIPVHLKWMLTAQELLKSQGVFWALTFLLLCFFIKSCYKRSLFLQNQLTKLLLCSQWIKYGLYAAEARYLALLLSSGLPLMESLRSLISQTSLPLQQSELSHVYESLLQGQTLTQAYQLRNWYDSYFADMLNIAEETGTLAEAYQKLADHYGRLFYSQLLSFKDRWQPVLMLIIGLLIGSWVLLLYYPLIQLGYTLG